MNQLNNNQLILLAILVSFVTSIATGIFTVSLMDQAPPSVTRTINRVVETTVERVVPSGEKIVTEKIVIEKENEVVVEAIEKASPGIIEIYSSISVPVEGDTADTDVIERREAIGFFISEDGYIVTAIDNASVLKKYYIISEGERITLSLEKSDELSKLALFKVETEEGVEEITWPTLALAGSSVKVGQTAIVLDPGAVAISFISGVAKGDDGGDQYKLHLEGDRALPGRPVINATEGVIGVLDSNNYLITANVIETFLSPPEEASEEGPEEV